MKRDKDFNKLQRLWYQKLADEGFEDIEWTSSQRTFEHNSPFLQGFKDRKDRPTFEHTQNWYQLVENYYTNCTTLPKTNVKQPKLHRIILEQYKEGVPYRAIVRHINRNYTKRLAKRRMHNSKPFMNLNKVFNVLQIHLPYIIEWNRTHPDGRLYAGNEDFFVDEVFIKDPKTPSGNA